MPATTKRSSMRKKSEPENKAKVAFQEYKQRLRQTPTANASRASFPPAAQPFPQMPPAWAVPPPPGAPFPQNINSTGMLADRVGETLKLSMTLLNSGLGMGIRFLQGLTNSGPSYGDCACHYPPSGCGCGPTCSCSRVDCCQVVGCEPSCCCTPSVGSCC